MVIMKVSSKHNNVLHLYCKIYILYEVKANLQINIKMTIIIVIIDGFMQWFLWCVVSCLHRTLIIVVGKIHGPNRTDVYNHKI